MPPLCGSMTIRIPVNMFPLYDHMNIIMEIPIFIKKAPAGRHISRTRTNKEIKEPQSGETLGSGTKTNYITKQCPSLIYSYQETISKPPVFG